ncbi:hypothetical protein B0H63DRAFT_523621 [Podospora didyma]|uniref:Uncharacterized protein n=1 Tax=Podospora didyma TaxID=330526 RepID=A0AAE0NG47_9PEZI|nr:hypothetical protein B0H63DRAFT_523621 [Podospora didyma]
MSAPGSPLPTPPPSGHNDSPRQILRLDQRAVVAVGHGDDPSRHNGGGRLYKVDDGDKMNIRKDSRYLFKNVIRTATRCWIWKYPLAALLVLLVTWLAFRLMAVLIREIIRTILKDGVKALVVTPVVSVVELVVGAWKSGGTLWDEFRCWSQPTLSGWWTSASTAFYVFGTSVGLLEPAVLPHFNAHDAVAVPIRSSLLGHVNGMGIAHRVAAPHVHEMQGFRGPDDNQLHFPDELSVTAPAFIFDAGVEDEFAAIKTDNEWLGKIMRRGLEDERGAVSSFRKGLPVHPAAMWLERPATSSPRGQQQQRPSNWQRVWASAWAWATRSRSKMEYHLLSQAARLESILSNGIAMHAKWRWFLENSKMAGIETKEEPVCEAYNMLSEMLGDMKKQVNAEIKESLKLGSPPLTGGHGGGNRYVAQVGVAAGLTAVQVVEDAVQHVQIVKVNYGHMCDLIRTNHKDVTRVNSKLARDKRLYTRGLKNLDAVRHAIKGSQQLTEAAVVLNFERQMDDIADGVLKGFKFWEEGSKR